MVGFFCINYSLQDKQRIDKDNNNINTNKGNFFVSKQRPVKKRSAPEKPQKDKVIWTDAEWDRLADIVFTMRMNQPEETLVAIVQKAMSQMPADRQRRIHAIVAIKPLISRLKTLYSKMRAEILEVTALRHKAANAKTKDDIIKELSDSEIFTYFGERLLSMMTPDELLSRLVPAQIFEAVSVDVLMGEATRRLAEALLTKTNPIGQVTVNSQPRKSVDKLRQNLPKVVVVGLKNNQQHEVLQAIGNLADLKFIDKNRSGADIQKGADLYVVWLRFTSHSTTNAVRKCAEPGRIIIHTGGLEKLIEATQHKLLDLFYA